MSKPTLKKKKTVPAKRKKPRAPTKPFGRWSPIFLKELRKTSNVSHSAKTAGVSRRHAYVVKDKNSSFDEDWTDALAEGIDYLEEEAFRRAVEGPKPSDLLLIFLLKAHRPERYREPSRGGFAAVFDNEDIEVQVHHRVVTAVQEVKNTNSAA